MFIESYSDFVVIVYLLFWYINRNNNLSDKVWQIIWKTLHAALITNLKQMRTFQPLIGYFSISSSVQFQRLKTKIMKTFVILVLLVAVFATNINTIAAVDCPSCPLYSWNSCTCPQGSEFNGCGGLRNVACFVAQNCCLTTWSDEMLFQILWKFDERIKIWKLLARFSLTLSLLPSSLKFGFKHSCRQMKIIFSQLSAQRKRHRIVVNVINFTLKVT